MQPRSKRVRLDETNRVPRSGNSQSPPNVSPPPRHETTPIPSPDIVHQEADSDAIVQAEIDQEEPAVSQVDVQYDDSSLRRFIIAQDSASMNQLLEHIAGIHKAFADMRSEIGDLNLTVGGMRAQVNMLVLKSDLDEGVSVGGGAGRNDRVVRCDALLPHFNLIFNTIVIVKVVMASVVHMLAANSGTCHDHTPGMDICTIQCIGNSASVHLAAMLFGKRANMGKSVLQVGTGKEHSKLKKFLVLSLIRNAQGNSFCQFEVSGNGHADGSSTCETPSNAVRNRVNGSTHTGRIPQPAWIKPGGLTNEHVETSRHRSETKVDRSRPGIAKKKKKDDRPTAEEVSVRCVDRLYKRITSHLHMGRDRARNLFFDEIGYAMVPWSAHSIPDEIEPPNLSWAFPDTDMSVTKMVNVPLSLLPDNVIHPSGGHDNNAVLGSFLKRCLDMIVVVEHGVHVIREAGGVEDGSPEQDYEASYPQVDTLPVRKTKIRRLVNLVEVSLRFLNAYCGRSLECSMSDILETHAEVIHASFAVAATYRGMIESFITSYGQHDGGVRADESRGFISSVCCEDVSLADFLPTPSNKQKTFHKMVLSMSDEDFVTHNVPCGSVTPPSSSPSSMHTRSNLNGDGVEDVVEGHDFVLLCP